MMSEHSTIAPEINRRRFLTQTAMAGAAVAVAAPVVAAEPEIHPLARLHELHEEASKLMVVHNEWMGGEWELRIRAPNAGHPVVYTSLDAEKTPLEQAWWHIRELERLIVEDGGNNPVIIAQCRYGRKDFRGFGINVYGQEVDSGMFAGKAVRS